MALTQRIVAACAAARVRRYLHMSALGADPNGPSMYQRSKGDAEAGGARLAARLDDLPAVGGLRRRGPLPQHCSPSWPAIAPVLPIGGADVRFQPVWVEDVAHAFVNCLDNDATVGKTYELCGPEGLHAARTGAVLAGAAAGAPAAGDRRCPTASRGCRRG
ncbi:MAG: hypothetical protein MZW92_43730 [Comamonadaceae bacterium]|nr:hypothetical protein [Comamonadaceae bacterium]